jgi:cell wall-associated NlpC family hydrolase
LKKNLVTAAATAGLIFTAFGASASAQENTYTVHPGDSLWKISKLNNVSVDNLKAWNHLSSDRVYVNQKLSLNYTAKSGDSLWAIARAYGTTVSELKSTNGLTTDLIQIGQPLKIPAAIGSASSATISTTNNDTTSYVIQKGDSLSTIGARYHLTVSELKSMNQLTSNKIIAGKILKLRSDRANSAAIKASAASTAAVEAPTATTESQAVEKAETPATTSQPAVQPATSQAAVNPAAPVASQAAVNPAAPVTSQAAANPAAPVASQQAAANPAAPVTSQATVKPAAPVASQAAVNPAASNVQAVIAEAEKYIGTPYLWGGNTPSPGFDCSGFVKYVLNKFGVSIPRTTETQWAATTPVNSPSIGDLVFFTTYQPGPSHVGFYLGNNKFISATDSGVKISDMTSSYWGPRYLGARKAF